MHQFSYYQHFFDNIGIKPVLFFGELINESHQYDPGDADLIKDIQSKNLKILIVDDETSFRKAMRFKLQRKYKIVISEATSGKEAQQILNSGIKFDLIFLDLKMQGWNGLKTLEKIRHLHPKERVVVMSAYNGSDALWDQAQEQGLKCLAKPLENIDLLEVLLNV